MEGYTCDVFVERGRLLTGQKDKIRDAEWTTGRWSQVTGFGN
jgi:hypothetical protein